MEFPGDEIDGGVGEILSVVTPDAVGFFFGAELDGGKKLALDIVDGDEEGIVLSVGGTLDAEEGVDFDAGGAFLRGVVIKELRDVSPAGGRFVEPEEG